MYWNNACSARRDEAKAEKAQEAVGRKGTGEHKNAIYRNAFKVNWSRKTINIRRNAFYGVSMTFGFHSLPVFRCERRE